MAYTTIDDPSAHFQIATWTGNTSAPRSITNDGNSNLQPDWVWGKNRTTAGTDHEVYDSNRGTGTSYNLKTSSTAAEGTSTTYGQLTSFDTDGFTVNAGGSNDDFWNENGSEFVAWQWKCAGGTTTNQTGANIDSVTQANTTAGFSIVTYTGNGGAGQSVKHGLGATPQMFIIKRRDGTGDWFVYHQAMGNTKHLHLNTTAAVSTTSDFGNYGPDSTSFYVNNTGTCINTETYIAYCFAEKQGYSKFGTYTGTLNANGPMVYTGFKPAFVLTKNTTNAGYNWTLNDHKRNPFNEVDHWIWPDDSGSEYDGAGIGLDIDFLSNGFKIRTSRAEINNTATYIYMAFAENPFVTSTGIPTTAR